MKEKKTLRLNYFWTDINGRNLKTLEMTTYHIKNILLCIEGKGKTKFNGKSKDSVPFTVWKEVFTEILRLRGELPSKQLYQIY